MTDDDGFRTWFARFCRVGNPPAMAAAAFRASLVSDVRAALPLIQIPTLFMQAADAAGVLEEIESFLAGDRPHVSTDRLLATVLTFTDRGVHRLKGVPDEWQLYAVAT